MSPYSRTLEPGTMEPPAGAIPFLFLPGRDLFAVRAGRFRQLSTGHPLGEYLSFLALLAEVQQDVLDRFPPFTLTGLREQATCHQYGLTPLHARTFPRDPVWREGLAVLLERMAEADLPRAARDTVAGLINAGEDVLEEAADKILAGNLNEIHPGRLPFIAAALQVYWVRMAQTLEKDTDGQTDDAGTCPVCGSAPVAGVVLGSGAERGLRYLCCSLCGSRWHKVRITCSNCSSTRGIDYYTLTGTDGAVKAESCDGCGAYLKLFYLEKDSRMEATADDLTTISLDMLMGDEGKARRALNLFLHPGRG